MPDSRAPGQRAANGGQSGAGLRLILRQRPDRGESDVPDIPLHARPQDFLGVRRCNLVGLKVVGILSLGDWYEN